jgi:hypothetical protein
MPSDRFIDRRPQGRNKSAVNRQRFMRRYKKQIREAVRKAVSGRSITQIDEEGENITIPNQDISEPQFTYGKGGNRDLILPGNKEFSSGDQIQRPPDEQGKGNGSSASDKGEGEDEFVFHLSREEFLDVFFEDLALPNLLRTKLAKMVTMKTVRAGYTSEGVPSNINVVRSLKGAMGRRMALKGPLKREIADLQSILDKVPEPEKATLRAKIDELERHIKSIPFIDPFDLRYNNRVKRPQPSTQAVMFCLMDVSGSMDETKKEIAKRFFILLYLFLSRTYENVELVFIRHHTSAKEVNEHDFFYSRETGGTVVSSALEKMSEILSDRYPPSDWNIYAAQASDGDNWNNDSPRCQELLQQQILPLVQYFAYIEILPRHHQSLWEVYHELKETHENFAMQNIEDAKDIYPVFRSLFKQQAETV